MKILSLNSWLLPPPFAKDNQKRLRDVIRLIKDEDPDVICLQEAWLNMYVRRLKRELPEFTFKSADTFLFNRSGLVFASKQSPKSVTGERFPDTKEHNLEEKLAGKGWQLAEFENINLLHTHLYASKGTDYKMTKAQLQQLESLDIPKNTVLVGDCNLTRDEFCEFVTRFVCPENETHTITSDNPYASARLNSPSDAKWSYITPTKKADISVKTRVRKQPVVSDHYALIGELEV